MASSTICLPGTASSTPSINPKPRTSLTKPCLRARSFSFRWKYPPTSCMCGSRPSRMSRNSSPTRHASGPPPNVDPCMPGLMAAAALAFARIKPSGIPHATGLAATPAELAKLHHVLDPDQLSHLQRLLGSWALLSDLSFSDLVLLVPVPDPAEDADGPQMIVLGQIRRSE